MIEAKAPILYRVYYSELFVEANFVGIESGAFSSGIFAIV